MRKIGRLRYFIYLGTALSLTCLSSSLRADANLRIIASNLTSGNKQTYNPGHGLRILKALKPDVVLVQEFSYGDDGNQLNEFAREILGNVFFVFREPEDGGIPNGVISVYPILEAKEINDPVITNRDIAWARIDVPGDADLWAFSLHLYHKNSDDRATEAAELVEFIRRGVPEKDFVVVGGDLNTKSHDEPAIKVLGKVVSTKHIPVCTAGKCGTNSSRKQPYDWVMPNENLEKFHVPVVIGESETAKVKNVRAKKISTKAARSFEHGLVFDSRTFPDLSAVSPVEKNDSAAENMQHMAVVKDFAVPE